MTEVAHYTTLFLIHRGKWLLLKRAGSKKLQPNRFTGLGGRVETNELGSIENALLRELQEEVGLTTKELSDLALRRILMHNRTGEPVTLLFYFTATLLEMQPLACTEGTLHWLEPQDFAGLDIIETTAQTLLGLIEDVAQAPKAPAPKLGFAHYEAEELTSVSWSG